MVAQNKAIKLSMVTYDASIIPVHLLQLPFQLMLVVPLCGRVRVPLDRRTVHLEARIADVAFGREPLERELPVEVGFKVEADYLHLKGGLRPLHFMLPLLLL